MKTVIVGGVAAGASTGARLRRLDESAEIVILERDHYVSFANCGLPYHIGGEIPDRESLLLQTPGEPGQEPGAGRPHRAGRAAHRPGRQGGRGAGREAAGGPTASPTTRSCCAPAPSRSGRRSRARTTRGVDVLRNIPDMDHIIARLDQGATSAVVVGGSYIGLELTEAFRARGLQTTVVERTERLMPWLDPEMTRILDYHVEHPRRGPPARHLRRRRSAAARTTASWSTSPTARRSRPTSLVMAAGARPNVDLARDAGIEIGPRGGIEVDAHMRTSAPDILAAGDAVETPHFLTGEPTLSMLAGPANREGRIAADTIAGRDSAYRGTQGTAVVKVFDMTAGGTGHDRAAAAGRRHRLPQGLHQPQRPRRLLPGHRAAVPQGALRPRRRHGCSAGRCSAGTASTSASTCSRSLVRAGMTVFDLEHLELAYAPPYGAAKDPVNMVGLPGARTCCAATSTSGTPRTTRSAPTG